MTTHKRIISIMRNILGERKSDLEKLAKFGNIMRHVRTRRLETRKWDDFIVY